MTVGHFTIETSGSTDEDFLEAYDVACKSLLGCLMESIPPWKNSPTDSAVTLEKLDTFYTYRFSTPMGSEEIEAITLEISGFEQFRILNRPNNFALVP